MADDPIDPDKRQTIRRFAAVGALSSLFDLTDWSSTTEENPESDVRQALAGYIASTPGAHFSKIRDELHLGTGETQYHLQRLVDAEAIEASRDGEYKRFFTAGTFSQFERQVLGYLRRQTPRGMILCILRDPQITGATLASRLDVSAATVSTHLQTLETAGIVTRDQTCQIANPETVITLIVRFCDSFDAAAVRFAEEAPEILSYDPDASTE
jgi:predicted transcriptional regulator